MAAKDQCTGYAKSEQKKEELCREAQTQDIELNAESVVGRLFELADYADIYLIVTFPQLKLMVRLSL